MNQLQEIEKKWVDILNKKNKSTDDMNQLEIIRSELEQCYREDVRELNDEIKLHYPEYDDVWDLVNTKNYYPLIIPILLIHSQKSYHPKNIEGIVRALGTKDAAGQTLEPMLKLLSKYLNTHDGLSGAITNTISLTIKKHQIPLLVNYFSKIDNIQNFHFLIPLLNKIKRSKKN